MCKPAATSTIADEFIDEGLQNIGVRFTDGTAREKTAINYTREKDRKAEEAYAFQKRKHRVLMVAGLILTTAAMIAFIEYGQISFYLAMCFNAALAGVFGYNIK